MYVVLLVLAYFALSRVVAANQTQVVEDALKGDDVMEFESAKNKRGDE